MRKDRPAAAGAFPTFPSWDENPPTLPPWKGGAGDEGPGEFDDPAIAPGEDQNAEDNEGNTAADSEARIDSVDAFEDLPNVGYANSPRSTQIVCALVHSSDQHDSGRRCLACSVQIDANRAPSRNRTNS